MLIEDNDKIRIAYTEDFQDTTITLTPQEWQELKSLLEYRKQTKPCGFAKANATIYKKLVEGAPKLKECYREIDPDDVDDDGNLKHKETK